MPPPDAPRPRRWLRRKRRLRLAMMRDIAGLYRSLHRDGWRERLLKDKPEYYYVLRFLDELGD